MGKEKETSDSEWVRLQRLEDDRRRWLLGRLRSVGGWVIGAFTALWAGIDALLKLMDWVKK
jgi:hypothetical protein